MGTDSARALDAAWPLAAFASAQFTQLRKHIRIHRKVNNGPDRNELWKCQRNSHTKSFKAIPVWNFLAWSKEVKPRISRIKPCSGKMRNCFNSLWGSRIYSHRKQWVKHYVFHGEQLSPVLALGQHLWQRFAKLWSVKCEHHYVVCSSTPQYTIIFFQWKTLVPWGASMGWRAGSPYSLTWFIHAFSESIMLLFIVMTWKHSLQELFTPYCPLSTSYCEEVVCHEGTYPCVQPKRVIARSWGIQKDCRVGFHARIRGIHSLTHFAWKKGLPEPSETLSKEYQTGWYFRLGTHWV